MKRKHKMFSLFLSLVMLLLCMQVPAAATSNALAEGEPIESAFTDAAFLTAVRETIGKTNGEPIYQSDVQGVTVLEVFDLEIANLDGLEYFTGLKELYCYFNDLITLDLSHNPNLEVLDCSYNIDLASIGISSCPELRLLDCNYTALEMLDVSGNTKLTRLVCYDTFLEALDISSNPLLEILDVWGGRLKNLDVSNNRKLKYLDCSWNDIGSLESVTGLENCTDLEDGAFVFEPQSMEGHDWIIDRVTLEPTCTQKGKRIYLCKDCGLTKTGDIDVLGHWWDAWTITTEPTLAATGTAERVCRNDNSHQENVPLPVLTDTTVWTRGEVVDGLQEYASIYGTVAIALPSPPPIEPGTPDKPDTPQMVFTDVRESDWFYDSVKDIYERGLMVGTDKDRFSPKQNASRAMIAAVLWRLEGSPEPAKDYAYTDCNLNAYYAQAVAWATEQEVLMGYGEGLFGPNDPIAREQLAAALYRYAGKPKAKKSLDHFADGNSVSDYALDALRWAVETGIISGKGDGILDPTGKATRAEVAAMIHRFLRMQA